MIGDKGYEKEILEKKGDTWRDILATFNSKYPGDVDIKTLKGLWKRVKEKAKKDLDEERRD